VLIPLLVVVASRSKVEVQVSGKKQECRREAERLERKKGRRASLKYILR